MQYYELFKFMADEHDLILIDSQLEDIIRIVRDMNFDTKKNLFDSISERCLAYASTKAIAENEIKRLELKELDDEATFEIVHLQSVLFACEQYNEDTISLNKMLLETI